MKKSSLFYALIGAVMAIQGAVAVHAETLPDIYQSGKSEFGSNNAVGGYDAVAYQKANAAVPGSKQFSYAWKGATWQFSSAENLEAFKAAPDTYAPKYGGYCAYGVSQGYAVHGDPQAWTVVDGKLYLNYDKDVQKTWNNDRPGYIKLSEQNWPKALTK